MSDYAIPKVSIVMPVHNSSKYLIESIQSVQAQKYLDWELLVIDDCSTDDSVSIVKTLQTNDDRIQLIQLTHNHGAAFARNKCIEIAKGRYIAFLDSDDLWMPEKLDRQLAFMQKTNCPLTYTAYVKINEDGVKIGDIGVPDKVSYKDMLKTCYLGCLTVIYDTEYFGKTMMPNIRKRQDYGLWLKLLKKTPYAMGMNQILGQYRLHQNSLSANKLLSATYTWKLLRHVEKLSLIQSMYYFLHYSLRGFIRNKMPSFARRVGILN